MPQSKKTHFTEKDSKSLTEFYHKTAHLILEKIEISKRNHKPLLILVAETHEHSSDKLLLQSILLDICQRQGIKNLYLEGNPQDRQLFELQECRQNGPIADFCLMHKIASKNKFDVIHLEEKITHIDNNTPFSLRETEMINTFLSHKNQSGIYMGGVLHLEPLYKNKVLNEQFTLLAVNSAPKEIKTYIDIFFFRSKDIVEDRSISIKEAQRRLKYIKKSKEIFSETLAKTDFEPTTRENYAALFKQVAQIGKRFHTPIAPASPIESACAETFVSSTSKAQILQALPSDHSASLQEAAAVEYPCQTLPFSLIGQFGLWAAHQFGMCEKPVLQQTSVVFHDHLSQALFDQDQKRTAAEHFLTKRFSSLEIELDYCFGKSASSKNHDERNQQENFLINLINGEYNPKIHKQFSTAMVENDCERNRKMKEVLQSVQGYHSEDLELKC